MIMKFLDIKKLFATLAVILCSVVTNAQKFEVDGLFYTITSESDLTVDCSGMNNSNENSVVTIPETVTYDSKTYSVTGIGDNTFIFCTGVTSITIPNSITKIGNQAFMGCSGVTSITVSPNNTAYDSRNNCNAIIETATNTLILGCKHTIIPNTVTTIGNYAFSDCTFSSITIPNSVTTIGNYAFAACPNLTSITIPNSVTTIGNGAFNTCSKLTNITIGNGVTTIGHNAFRACTALTSITIPNSVTKIGGYAFEACSELTSITFENGITTIWKDAFRNCPGLTSITIPNSVTTIESFAFGNCEELTSVTIGNGIRTIGDNPFGGNHSLRSIYILSETPPSVTRNSFSDSYLARFVTLYVPQGCLSAYQTARFWRDFKFKNIVEHNATGIENFKENTIPLKITIAGIQLSAAKGKTVAVYTVNGTCVANISNYTGEEIVLEKGVYIVRVENETIKIKL